VIVLDPSGVVALLDRSDVNHSVGLGVLQRERQPIVVPTGIMAEVTYVLQVRAGDRAVPSFLDSIIIGTTRGSCGDDDLPRVRELMIRYADLPLGYADATVLTFDHRHFGTVAREGRIAIVP
jgi:hypothetical protein